MLNLRKNTKKLFIRGAVITAMLTTAANAVWAPNLKVETIVVLRSGDYLVKFDKDYDDATCNSWGFRFKTDSDKLYKALYIALLLNKSVGITFDPSPTPGTTNEACKKMAIIEGVFTSK